MTEKQLKKLGFKKEYYYDEVAVEDFYYFILDIGRLGFVTVNCSDEIRDSEDWTVGIFDYNDFAFKNAKDLKKVIKLLKNNLK